MATLKDVVFDCRHPASLARFWATAMDGYDAGASEVGKHENWVVMADPEGNEFCVFPA